MPQVYSNAMDCLSEEDRTLPAVDKLLPMLQVWIGTSVREEGQGNDKQHAQNLAMNGPPVLTVACAACCAAQSNSLD
jgi:hypothetical protein